MIQPDILQVVRAFADEQGFPRTLLLGLAWLESGFDAGQEVGDDGRAHGLYSVRQDVWGLPAHRWLGVDGTRAAMETLTTYFRWRVAFDFLGGTPAFTTDPTLFLYHWAPRAQASSQPSWERCVEAMQQAERLEPPAMTVPKPDVLWVPAHANNYTVGRGGYALEFLVLHIMEGTLAGCDSWFANAAARASTHFGVGKTGAIHQYVSLADTAYAHGLVEVTYEQAPRVLQENWGVNPNQIGVGIEHEGFTGDAMTDAQFDASTRLAAWLFAAHLLTSGATGVAVDRAHVLRHAEVSPISRKRCPGYAESLITRYLQRVNELITPPPDDAPRWIALSLDAESIGVNADLLGTAAFNRDATAANAILSDLTLAIENAKNRVV